MKVKKLIEVLSELNPDSEIMILDGFNGGGEPREINLGPTTETISQSNQDEGADCEELQLGQTVYVIGFGCY